MTVITYSSTCSNEETYLIEHVKLERTKSEKHVEDKRTAEVAEEEEEDCSTSTTTSSIEEGFTIDWESSDVVELLKTHYSYLFNQMLNSNQHESSNNNKLKFKLTCQEPKRGMENHSIIISLCAMTQNPCERKYMLRTYADPMKTCEYIAFELDTLYKLRQNLYLPVPCIIETTKFMNSRMDIRDCIVPFKDHLAVMFEYCEGFHMNSKQRNVHYIQSVAEFTGHLHRCTLQHENFDPRTAADSQSQPPFLLIDERFQLHVGRLQPERLTFEYHWEVMNDIFLTHGITSDNGDQKQEQQQQDQREVSSENEKKTRQQMKLSDLDEKGREMLHKMYQLCHRNLKRYTEEEQNVLERRLPRSLNHGDAHTSNVLFRLDKSQQQQQEGSDVKPMVSAVVDWDDSFIGPCIIDFVNCLFFWCIKPSGCNDCCCNDICDEAATTTTDVVKSVKNPIKPEYVTAYVNAYTRARGFGLTELEKQYFFDYLYLTMFSQICFIMAQHDVLAPWGSEFIINEDEEGEEEEEEREPMNQEDYLDARSMLSFILYTASLFEDDQIRSLFTQDMVA